MRIVKRPETIWEPALDEKLRALIIDEGMTGPQAARKLRKDPELVKKQLRRLKLLKIATRPKAGSKPQRQLYQIVQELFPNEPVKSEVHLMDRLFLDVWIPKRKIGIEYQGRQHEEFLQHWHQDKEGFRRQLERDRKKREICEQNEITLVCISWSEPLTHDFIHKRIMQQLTKG